MHTLATSEDLEAPSWWNAYCLTAIPGEHAHIMCEVDLQTRYTISLYWAVTTLTTIGYGDILPVTFAEYVYTIFCMYVGVSFYAFIAANVATVLASLDTNTQLHNQKMDKLNEFLKATKMPSSLRRRLRKYFSLYWTQLGALMPYDTRKLIEEINLPALRSEVTGALYKDALARVPFLHNREANFVTNIVTKLVPLHVLHGELVVREGEVGTNIFFLFNGKVASIYRERTVKYMVPGSYFGDVAVLLTERHLMSFRAHGICDLYILSKDDLSYALQHFPHYTFEMRELAVSRLTAMNEDIENLNASPSGTNSTISNCTAPELEPESETGTVDTQTEADGDNSRRSSVLSDMFEERLSERLSQLLPNDATRGSRHTHGREQQELDRSNENLLTQFLDENEGAGAVVDEPPAALSTTLTAPPKAQQRMTKRQADDLHDEVRGLVATRQLSSGDSRPTSSAQARAQAKLDFKTTHDAPIHTGSKDSKRTCITGAIDWNAEQLLVRQVLDATATLSRLKAALEQVLDQHHTGLDPATRASIDRMQVEEPRDNLDDIIETSLTCVEEGESEEEEEDSSDQEKRDEDTSLRPTTSAGNGSARQFSSSHAHFASVSPPPPPTDGRGLRGKPTPRGSRLRRKDTAATGVLASSR